MQGSWDTLSLLSHLSGDGTDIGATRFETIANDLVARLADETLTTRCCQPLELKGVQRERQRLQRTFASTSRDTSYDLIVPA